MANPFALIGSAPGMVGGYGLPQAPAMVPTVNPTPVAAPMQATQPGKVGFWDKLDAFFGGDVGNAIEAIRQRKIAAAKQHDLLAAIDTLPPEERTIAMANPQKWAEEKAKDLSGYTLSAGEHRFGPDGKEVAHVATKPTALNTSHGVYEYDPEKRTAEPLAAFDPPGPKAPMGYQFGPDGLMHFIPGGPADPTVIAGNALKRRRVTVENPMPSHAKPSAAAPVAAPAPWTRKW